MQRKRLKAVFSALRWIQSHISVTFWLLYFRVQFFQGLETHSTYFSVFKIVFTSSSHSSCWVQNKKIFKSKSIFIVFHTQFKQDTMSMQELNWWCLNIGFFSFITCYFWNTLVHFLFFFLSAEARRTKKTLQDLPTNVLN